MALSVWLEYLCAVKARVTEKYYLPNIRLGTVLL